MAYALTQFGDVDLPAVLVTDDLSTGEVASTLLPSLGGVWDVYGANRRLPQAQEMAHLGLYHGEERWLVTDRGFHLHTHANDRLRAATAAQDLARQLDRLKARIGERDRLWRRRDADGVRQWRWARLLHVRHTEPLDLRAAAVAEVEARFGAAGAGWASEAAVYASADAPSNSWRSLNTENAGSLPVRDAYLTVTVTGGTLTGLDVAGPGIGWSWNGTAGVGAVLRVDAGASSIQLNAADAYGGFSFDPAHTATGWLPLQPGLNLLRVRARGGDAAVTLAYYPLEP